MNRISGNIIGSDNISHPGHQSILNKVCDNSIVHNNTSNSTHKFILNTLYDAVTVHYKIEWLHPPGWAGRSRGMKPTC